MNRNSQTLDRIRDAVGHYLRREITHGEAMEDVVTALEAAGRDPFASVERSRVGRESRSWAPRRTLQESAPVGEEPDARQPPPPAAPARRPDIDVTKPLLPSRSRPRFLLPAPRRP